VPHRASMGAPRSRAPSAGRLPTTAKVAAVGTGMAFAGSALLWARAWEHAVVDHCIGAFALTFCGQVAPARRSPIIGRGIAMRAVTDPREITRLISTSETAAAVLDTVGQFVNRSTFNQIHVSTAFVKLAKVQSTIEQRDKESATMIRLVNELRYFLSKRSLTAQTSANICWAIVAMEKKMPQLKILIPELMHMIQLVAEDMVAQHIANVMWACARCEVDSGASESLFLALAERTFLEADFFKAQEIAIVFGASGKLHKHGAPVSHFLDVLPILSEVAAQRADAMIPRDIANTLSGICDLRNEVSASIFERDLIPILAETFTKKAAKMTERQIELDFPEVALAFARLQIHHRPLIKTIASRCQKPGMLRKMHEWGLCALTWSYTDGFPDAEFSEFRKSLRAEVARRGTISEEMISRSQLGPDEWQL